MTMLSLTNQEKLVLAFIGIVCLVGLGLNSCQKITASFDLQKIIKEQKSFCAVDINKAGFQDLAKIPELGPVLAEAIISFRNHNGHFKSLEELKLIKGIDAGKFSRIKNLLIIN